MAFECISVFSYATPHHNLTCKEWEDSVPYRNIIYFVYMSRTVEEIREKRSIGQLHHLNIDYDCLFSGHIRLCDLGAVQLDGWFVVVIESILVILVKDKLSRFIARILPIPVLFYEV